MKCCSEMLATGNHLIAVNSAQLVSVVASNCRRKKELSVRIQCLIQTWTWCLLVNTLASTISYHISHKYIIKYLTHNYRFFYPLFQRKSNGMTQWAYKLKILTNVCFILQHKVSMFWSHITTIYKSRCRKRGKTYIFEIEHGLVVIWLRVS